MPSRTAEKSRLEVVYARLAEGESLADNALAAVVFGQDSPGPGDPRVLRVSLQPLAGTGTAEVWLGSGPVSLGSSGAIRYACDGQHLFGSMDLPEAEHGGLEQAAETAYRSLLEFHAASAYPHVWRVWNLLTGINEGAGDEERYRLFCLGRARSFASVPAASSHARYPAATAIGRQGGEPRLQLYWLAASRPGDAVENPRQVSAYRYPSDYGPAAPSFSRAMLVPGPTLLVSGTASIVGHASVHHGDLDSQVEETMRNLETLLEVAGKRAGFGSSGLGPQSLLKVYLRNKRDAAAVEQRIRERIPGGVQLMLVAADVCRADLLLEIEAIHHG
jgi:chorismate lyase/3-hydroxybenzoate synthase